MATITPTQTAATLTSDDSHNSLGGAWEYAVPLDNDENAPIRDRKQQHHINGNSYHSRDSDNPIQTRPQNLRSRASDLTNGSDPDNLQDLYKSTSNPSMRSSRNLRKASNGALSSVSRTPTAEKDESKWIHRDKLAQIESRELIEAGLRVGRKPSSRFDRKEEKTKLLVSPEHANPEMEEYDMDDSLTPPKSFIPKPATVRGANSRIPIPKGVSPSATYSDTPGDIRSRSGSAGWNNSADQSPHSQDAAYELDEGIDNSPPNTPPRTNSANAYSDKSSPQKRAGQPRAAVPNGRKSATGTRNASGTPRQRNASNTKPKEEPKRPGTSSGNSGRPTTSHRTDGEPPWLSSMYKPDPRLPPDQQMLPTHAKRLAQEQWEKEGKTGTVYDKDFRLLNANAFPVQPSSPERRNTDNSDTTAGAAANDRIKTTVLSANWRTSQLESPRSQGSSGARPGTSGTEHGGYRIMPSTTSPKPPLTASSMNGQLGRLSGPTPALELEGFGAETKSEQQQKPSQPQVNEKEKEAGCVGCGCIIM